MLLGVTLVSSLQACGPSFEVIQEGDLRFAHCDRLDLDPEVAASHRLTCWREWRRMYVYGQTRDRIEYAQRRIAEIVSGDEGPPFELGGEPPGRSAVRRRPPERLNTAAAAPPMPATPTEPPPAVVPSPPPAPANGAPARPAPRPAAGTKPGDGCAAQCGSELALCREGCGARPDRCVGCEPDYRRCMRGCFQ